MQIYYLLSLALLFLCWHPIHAQDKLHTPPSQALKEVFVIGAVHGPTKNINEDTILAILERIAPTLILIEADHHVFSEDYRFIKTYQGNEWNAILRYQKQYPETQFRPFEIEGRNALRKQKGIYSGAGFIFDQVFDLDSLNQLSPKEHFIWNRLLQLSDTLAIVDHGSIQKINSSAIDNLVEERQFYQYKKVKEITDRHPSFAQKRTIGSNKDTLSFKEYFDRYSQFEQLRNYEMAENIMKYLASTKEQRIVVLVGYYHRFALINRLKYKEKELHFQLKDWQDLSNN